MTGTLREDGPGNRASRALRTLLRSRRDAGAALSSEDQGHFAGRGGAGGRSDPGDPVQEALEGARETVRVIAVGLAPSFLGDATWLGGFGTKPVGETLVKTHF